MPALPFSRSSNTTPKPRREKYIVNPTTLGEKLRNRGIEPGLLQKNAAKQFNVSEESITNWENGHEEPQVRYYPILINFLGYYPFMEETITFGGRIRKYRFLLGLNHVGLGKLFGLDARTIDGLENNIHKPQAHVRERLKNCVSV